jgi:hypothetical protein
MAGALGVQLGGVNHYDGQPLEKPTIGDAVVPLAPRHIRLANALMFVAAGLFLAVCLALRVGTIAVYGMANDVSGTRRVPFGVSEKPQTTAHGVCRIPPVRTIG